MRRLLAIALVALATSGAAPAPGTLQCDGSIADGDILIPAGQTMFGDDDAYVEEHGAHVIAVPAFRIDRHEVTNRQFGHFVAATGYVTEAERRGDSIVFVKPDAPVDLANPAAWWRIVKGANWRHPQGPASTLAGRSYLPVVHVSQSDAAAYARWIGRTLPTEAQFERAARAGLDRNNHQQPASNAANTWQGRFPDGDNAEDGHASLAPVSCYQPNAFGLHDMIGNAWEWTSTPFAADHRDGAPVDPALRVIKGGSYLCTPYYCARYRPSARQSQDVHGGTSHIGFRTVARDGSKGRL